MLLNVWRGAQGQGREGRESATRADPFPAGRRGAQWAVSAARACTVPGSGRGLLMGLRAGQTQGATASIRPCGGGTGSRGNVGRRSTAHRLPPNPPPSGGPLPPARRAKQLRRAGTRSGAPGSFLSRGGGGPPAPSPKRRARPDLGRVGHCPNGCRAARRSGECVVFRHQPMAALEHDGRHGVSRGRLPGATELDGPRRPRTASRARSRNEHRSPASTS